jgi:pSer/pThr/pTyr-binding forkhead associated (FHA) protein
MSWQSGFQISTLEGPDQGATTPLNFTRMTIGRARSEGSRADGWVLLFDKSVSRQHAELLWDENAQSFRLRHLSKTNLTWVDGEPLEGEVVLRPGHVIRIGSSKLAVCPVESDAEGEIPEESPLASAGELTEKLSLGTAAVALALRGSECPRLFVVDGADRGLSEPLSGYYLTIGRGNVQADQLSGDKAAMKFDQMLSLTDEQVLPNHLILKWDELQKGFSIWKNPTSPCIPIMRQLDGFLWQSNLTETGGIVREGDRIQIGSTTLELRASKESSQEASIRPLPLTADES